MVSLPRAVFGIPLRFGFASLGQFVLRIGALGLVLISRAWSAAPGYQLAPGIGVRPDGSVTVGEVLLSIQHFGPEARSSMQGPRTISGSPKLRGNVWELDGKFAVAKTSGFALRESLVRTPQGAIAYDAKVHCPMAIPTQQLALGVLLPVDLMTGVELSLDKATFDLPEAPFQETLRWREVQRLTCPLPQGKLVVEGPVDVQLQDGRNFADKRHFRMRLLFRPDKGELRESSLAVTLKLLPYAGTEPRPDFGAKRMVTIDVGDDWSPLEHAVSTKAGSILDWSAMNEKPAGSLGRIVVRDGHLEAEGQPGRRVRLFGTNICDRTNFLTKPDAEALAVQLARAGYNAARLHHYDRHLVRSKATLAAGWDAAKLDQLDYLFHCLKREGLYLTIDLYTVRPVVAGEIGEIQRDVSLNEFKALVAISPSARANWKEFARRLLTHVNPYTGLAWKDDPALVSICLLNEDNVPANWNSAPDIAELYEERFADWQRGHPDGRSREQQWARFLFGTHAAMTSDCAAFVRGLGARALITDANYRQDLPLTLIRQELDLVDNHNYHDLKHFLVHGWSLPYQFHQRCALMDAASLPRSLFVSRIFGKPYTVTEFNYCYPNHFRAEGGPLMGAYAALQDWDGIFRYAYAHDRNRALSVQPVFYLDNASDPVNMLSDRIAALMFRRGDVQTARTRTPQVIADACLNSADPLAAANTAPPRELEQLGLVHQVGVLPAGSADDWRGNQPFEPGPQSDLTARITSETGELRLEPGAGRFVAVTPRTECFVLSGAETVRGGVVEVRNQGGFALICASAMDDRPLATSKRVLIIHLTDVQNRGVRFRDPGHTILEAWGGLPHLVRRGSADVRLRDAAGATVRALRMDGSAAHPVLTRKADSWLEFTAATVQPQGSCLIYELERP